MLAAQLRRITPCPPYQDVTLFCNRPPLPDLVRPRARRGPCGLSLPPMAERRLKRVSLRRTSRHRRESRCGVTAIQSRSAPELWILSTARLLFFVLAMLAWELSVWTSAACHLDHTAMPSGKRRENRGFRKLFFAPPIPIVDRLWNRPTWRM